MSAAPAIDSVGVGAGGSVGVPGVSADVIARVSSGQSAERRHPDWDELYRQGRVAELPWYNPELDPDLVTELDRLGTAAGRWLDIGTGPGTQAAELARRGATVTAIDVSPAAIAYAATHVPAGVTLLVQDATSPTLGGPFDYVLDLGCLHVLEPEARLRYVSALERLVRPGGLLFLKCFSTAEPEAGFGPRRFALEELPALFAPRFALESCRATTFRGPRAHRPKGWFVRFVRTDVV